MPAGTHTHCSFRRLALAAIAISLALAIPALAQRPANWRAYKKFDGLAESACESVTVGLNGRILVVHRSGISELDGYSTKNFPLPDLFVSRVSESPSGRLWAFAPGEFFERRDGQWTKYAVPEAAAALSADESPPKFFPVKPGRVLFLTADALMELNTENVSHPLIQPLRKSVAPGIGKFLGMCLGHDGALWISGENGVVKISGPLRNFKSESASREFVAPASLNANRFREPFESADGEIICIADSLTNGQKVVAQLAGERWLAIPAGTKNLTRVWRDPAQTIRAMTPDSLLVLDERRREFRETDELSAQHFSDLAAGPNGDFWLATSEGLFHAMPWLWRAPLSTNEAAAAEKDFRAELDRHWTRALAHPPPEISIGTAGAVFIARSGDVWLGGDRGLAWSHDGKWQSAVGERAAPDSASAFAETSEGKIWCASADKILEFDGHDWFVVRGGFDRVNAMLATRDQSVWVATDAGLFRFFHGAWLENGVEDGLPSQAIRELFEDNTGRLWANTARGFSVYSPDADADPPRVTVQRLTEKEGDIPEGGTITLALVGRDKWKFSSAGKLLFSYRLDQHDWSPFLDANSVSFTDLAPGKHYFQARAMDRNGNISTSPAGIEFAVTLLWYHETRLLVIALAGLAVALFFASLSFNRHRKLVRSYAEVERKVAERTRELELANRELLHSQKMNALGTLAAGIAHDFNNILSIIKGSAQIIEDNTDNPEKIRTRVDRIKTVVEQGSGVVNAMLGFSRESDGAAMPCDLNETVEDTIRLLGDRFHREVEVSFTPVAGLPQVRVSKDFVQQILLNFIFNAAEAMAKNKKIIIGLQRAGDVPAGVVLLPAQAGDNVRVWIRDFGCGISRENLPRVFEPFFTTKALSTRRGTGLGLSMVYELAKKLGAGLAVESVVNQGSTFTLILPVTETKP